MKIIRIVSTTIRPFAVEVVGREQRPTNKKKSLRRSIEAGATAVEYALMVGLLAIGVIGAATTLRNKMNHNFRRVLGGVSTVAGTGVAGFVNGPAATAQFNAPHGVAFDSSGNLFIADPYNHSIRKMTPDGTVSTFAGGGPGPAPILGDVDGVGTAARFEFPKGLAIDSQNNIFVADQSNNKIRKITPAGVVSTFYGTGKGDDTTLWGPYAVAVDSQDNVYIADEYNQRILKATPAGSVSLLAGSYKVVGHNDATGAAATFFYPTGLAVDASFNVYVADNTNNSIRKITPAGVVSTYAGPLTGNASGKDDGPDNTARFLSPTSVVLDSSGTLFVSDYGNHSIRKISPSRQVSTIAGSGNIGSTDAMAGGAAAQFWNPVGLAFSPNGELLVGDRTNHKIRIVDNL